MGSIPARSSRIWRMSTVQDLKAENGNRCAPPNVTVVPVGMVHVAVNHGLAGSIPVGHPN